jgi:Eukaryotic aspartyl protease
MLDTQTSGIWVASSNCTTGGCVGMSAKLGHSDSTTLEPFSPPVPWNSDYPLYGSVSGSLYIDTISFAGLTSASWSFGLADTVDSNFTGNVPPLAN